MFFRWYAYCFFRQWRDYEMYEIKNDGTEMKCPHLEGKFTLSCNIGKSSYLPSLFELVEYCRNKRHTICPLNYQSGKRNTEGCLA